MATPVELRSPLRFGVFEVDFAAGELRKNGMKLRLPAQPFQVLAILLEQPGEVITRDELRNRLWPGDTFVDFDHSLSTAINKIRDALSDSADQPRFIETRPRRGYRFIAPVDTIVKLPRSVNTGGQRPGEHKFRPGLALEIHPSATSLGRFFALSTLVIALALIGFAFFHPSGNTRVILPPGKIRIAVLPFRNLSGDPAQDYFSAGFTDELITQLARLNTDRLAVLAPTSSNLSRDKSISEVASTFDLQYIVEGTVRRDASTLRIDVQLIQASDQTHIWANSYSRNSSAVLRTQSELAEAIAHQIPANLHVAALPPPPVVNPQAHDAYLEGRLYLNNRSNPEKSVALFEQATRLDPGYAPAFAALAQAHILLGEVPFSSMLPRDAHSKSRAAAHRALELDSSSADAHAALGNSLLAFAWNLPAAEREFRLALELDPNHASAHEWLGMLYMAQGKSKEALEEGQRSLELDPVSPACHAFLAQAYYFAGEYEKSAEESRRILDVRPQFVNARYWLGSAYAQQKMYPEAIEQFRLGRQFSGDAPVMLMAYGYAQAMSGNRSVALATLRELQVRGRDHYISPIYFAGIYVGLNDKPSTLKFLNQAFDERNDRMIYLSIEPMVNPLRSDRAFQLLLRRINSSAQE